jgi:hypothetical protein
MEKLDHISKTLRNFRPTGYTEAEMDTAVREIATSLLGEGELYQPAIWRDGLTTRKHSRRYGERWTPVRFARWKERSVSNNSRKAILAVWWLVGGTMKNLKDELKKAFPSAEVWGDDDGKYMSGPATYADQSVGIGFGWTEHYHSDGRKDGYYEDYVSQYEVIVEDGEACITQISSTPSGVSILCERTVTADAASVITMLKNLEGVA